MYRDSCFNWLLAATGFVVVGLVLEGPELWHDIASVVRHWNFNRRFHFSLPEERAPDWAKVLAAVGWLLIVVGVAGEYVADSFVSKADGFVQKFDEILLTDAQRQTTLANVRSSAAYERAAQAEREAAQENVRAAEALKTAESEHLARVKLQQQLAPRRLSSKQIEGLADRFRALNEPGGIPIAIMSAAFDAESGDFAKDFETTFKAAGWRPTRVPWNQTGEPGLAFGMLADPTAPDQIPAAFASLLGQIRDAVISEGIPCKIVPLSPDAPISLNKPEKNVLYLLVGRKPEPVTDQK